MVSQIWSWQQNMNSLSAFANEELEKLVKWGPKSGSPLELMGSTIAHKVREFGVDIKDEKGKNTFRPTLPMFEVAVIDPR